MKLGIYVQTWHVGGVAAFCERLARGLHDLGHSPLLILATPYGKRDEAGRLAFERLVRSASFPVVCLHLNAFHPKERGWRAADEIGGLKCDVIFLSAHHALLGALPFLRRSTGLIGIAHTDDDDTYAEFRATEPYCAAYVGVSAVITETLQALRKALPQTAVRQIPYGAPAMPASGDPPSGPLRILTVSRLVQRQKRVLDLPRIWRQYIAKGGDGTLTICGPGEEAARLQVAFSEDSRHGRVTFAGAVPLDQMPEVYAAHDVLLSVSAYEGLPLTIIEAAHAGVYLIVSKTRSGHPELLDCLGEGRLCEVGDIDGFADTLLDISNRLDRVRRLRPLLQTRAKAMFALPRMVESYVQLAGQAMDSQLPARLQQQQQQQQPLSRPKVDFLRRLCRRWQYSRHYGWQNSGGTRSNAG